MKKSLTGKKWEILSPLSSKKEKIKTAEIIKELLTSRGVKTAKEQKEFLDPKSPETYSLKDLEIDEDQVKTALVRIKSAIKNKEKIIVYGDYDADGITGTAIMWEALNSLGAKVMPYIPERFTDGYGINSKSVERIKKQDPDIGLIITVDNGIVAHDAIDTSNNLGIDVIVTDHHEKSEKLPNALATVHTTLTSGSGVAWLMACKLGQAQGLELAAIGTVADQLPLVGFNRSLVSHGIEKIKKTERLGLLALFKDARVKENEISAYTLGFVVGPRINAMGRLGSGMDSLRLLCTKSATRAYALAKEVSKTNSKRQKVVEETVLLAKSLVKDSEGFIVVESDGFHEGVIGLAASKLVEEFYRPAMVLSITGGLAKASVRSISGVNIIEVIRKNKDLLVTHGGHAMAAGFSIKSENIEEFKKRLASQSAEHLTPELTVRCVKIDKKIEFNVINFDLYGQLTRFEPTGNSNYQPVFATEGIEIHDIKTVGEAAKHIKLKLKQGDKFYNAIWFNSGEHLEKLQSIKSEIDVAYCLDADTWNGNFNLQLRIKDIRL